MRFLIAIFTLLAVLAGPAAAHFDLNGRSRIVVLDREAGELFLRIPAPLVFSAELAARPDPAAPVKARFIRAEELGGRWGHRIDTAAIAADPRGFMAKVAAGYRLTSDEGPVAAVPFAVAVHGLAGLAPFATPQDTRAALDAPWADMPWAGDAVVEIGLKLDRVPARLSLSSTLPELLLPPEIYIDNHLLDWQGGGVQRFDKTGQMSEPVALERNLPRALGHMVWQGVLHIVEGPDHVLFVICLTLGAGALGGLLWAVTGFTVGHSLTLISGFLGFVPSGDWFVPGIEAAIAASIVLAGAMALRGQGRGPGFWLTASLGLLHGFGFSFVLGDVLGRQAPDLVPSLLSFNLGVEIGQVAIVALVWLLLRGLARLGQRPVAMARIATMSVAIMVATFWLIERIGMIREVMV